MPRAAGGRFLLSNCRALAMREFGAILWAELGDAAGRVPVRAVPDLLLRHVAPFNARIHPFVLHLGCARKTPNEDARRVLGWAPDNLGGAIVAAARNIVGKGLPGM